MPASSELYVLSGNVTRARQCYNLTPIIAASILIILMPYIHIGIIHLKIWVPDKPAVNRNTCSCSCFDTVFKGSYENTYQKVGYKHIYFNATSNTIKIWAITVAFMVLFYESVKYLINVYRTSQIRCVWLVLYLVNVYPHYYAWWSFFSYWNDDFYGYFYHHMFFSVTELISSGVVVTLCNAEDKILPWKLMTIWAINAVHVIAAGLDQFIENVIRGRGKNHMASRDIGLMIPDVLHLVIATIGLYRIAQQRKTEQTVLWSKKEFHLFISLVLVGSISCLLLRYF